jgi:hypothetical protein
VAVKARVDIEIIVDVPLDDELNYATVQQAVQDAIGHTGAVVLDVVEYEQVST